MEAILQKLNQLSSDLITKLEASDLDEITSYMTERDAIFDRLQELTLEPSQTQQLKPLVDNILQMDAVIVGRMLELQAEADTELTKLANARMAKSTYEEAPVEHESYFFDTKR